MSLVSRRLEEEGIATVIVGSAHDIVGQCGVPRYVFTDFPLGNPCGKPYDVTMQRAVVGIALDLLDGARHPLTVVRAPYAWDESGEWRSRVAH